MDSEQQTVYAWNLFIALGNWTPLIQLQCWCSREMRHLSVLQSLLSSLHIDWSVNKITVTRKLSCLSSTRENYTDCYNTSKMMKRTKLICVTTVLSSPVSGDNFWSSLVVENHLLLCPIKYLLHSDSSFVFRPFWSVFFFMWFFLLTILADQVCVFYWLFWLTKCVYFIDYFGWPSMCILLTILADQVCVFYWLFWLTKYVFFIDYFGWLNMCFLLTILAYQICGYIDYFGWPNMCFLLTILAYQICGYIDYFGWLNMCFIDYFGWPNFYFFIDYTVDTRYLDIGYLDIPDMLTYL